MFQLSPHRYCGKTRNFERVLGRGGFLLWTYALLVKRSTEKLNYTWDRRTFPNVCLSLFLCINWLHMKVHEWMLFDFYIGTDFSWYWHFKLLDKVRYYGSSNGPHYIKIKRCTHTWNHEVSKFAWKIGHGLFNVHVRTENSIYRPLSSFRYFNSYCKLLKR